MPGRRGLCSRSSIFAFFLTLTLSGVATIAKKEDTGESSSSTSIPLHETLFPSHAEEYDFSILDPYTIYGSPYGGFSRASTGRLARLPLVLPAKTQSSSTSQVDEGSSTEDSLSSTMIIRDYKGRAYACRVYPEDQLEPPSDRESLFQPPRLRDPSVNYSPQDTSSEGTTMEASHDVPEVRPPPRTEEATLAIILQNMHKLKDICGQIHKGWWSYQWCYQREISQFHIEIKGKGQKLEIKDTSSLGHYSSRTFDIVVPDNPTKYPPNPFIDPTKEYPKQELGRITEGYTEGDSCNGTPRETEVVYQCCDDEYMDVGRHKLQKHGELVQATHTSILDVEESKDTPCKYKMNICTELLCDTDAKKPPATLKDASNMTILGILDASIGNFCIHTVNTGWWTYELCHSKHLRQYHASSGPVARKKEDEYILGKYPNAVSADDSPDYEKIFNNTDTTKGSGNHAYYEIEYVGGDVCDATDVTDRAIVAGNRGSEKLQRASTVRYYCGSEPGLYVSEDSTCHYVAEVYVPALCQHPLFKAPAVKRELVKCLPVNADHERDNESFDFSWIDE